MYFGMGRETLWGWRWATIGTGFFTNAAIVGLLRRLCTRLSRACPRHRHRLRAGRRPSRRGDGSPILAGELFKHLGNDQLLTVSIIMAMGSVVSALLLWLLPMRDADAESDAAIAAAPVD